MSPSASTNARLFTAFDLLTEISAGGTAKKEESEDQKVGGGGEGVKKNIFLRAPAKEREHVRSLNVGVVSQ